MNKPKETNTYIQRTEQWLSEEKGLGDGEMSKGDQLYGDGEKINFWW